MQLESESPAATLAIAEEFAQQLKVGQLVALIGDLGAGKTLFTQGLCRGLGCVQSATSPSFTLLNIYEGRVRVYHLDCYRLERAAEIEELGPEELFYPADAVTIVEWAEKVTRYLPERRWTVEFQIRGAEHRTLTFINTC